MNTKCRFPDKSISERKITAHVFQKIISKNIIQGNEMSFIKEHQNAFTAQKKMC